MVFKYIFLLDDFYNNHYLPNDENCSVIIPISRDLVNNKKLYLQKLANPKISFCFGLLQTNGLQELNPNDIQATLGTFFFLPNYIKDGEAYLLVNNEGKTDSDSKHTSFIIELEEALSKQSITPISKNNLNAETSELNETCYFNLDIIEVLQRTGYQHDFSNVFKQILSDEAAGKYIVVPIVCEEDYLKKKKILESFESWMEENEKAYLQFLLAYKKKHSAYKKLLCENRKLRFRIENYTDYVKLLQETARWHVNEYHRMYNETQHSMKKYGDGNKDVASPALYNHINELQKQLDYIKSNRDSILNWYTKEYESLPKWYKRFGHVIKVLLGKRSFKSLYK